MTTIVRVVVGATGMNGWIKNGLIKKKMEIS